MTPAGNLTTLYSFTGVVDGGHPIAALTLATDGNLYGTTPEAGQFNGGTAFRITPSGSFTLLHAFSGTDGTGRDGTSPRARLLQASDGNFYGTTFAGGSFNKGTVFKMSPGGGVSLVHSLAGSPEGASPVAGLIQVPDGSLFGTTTSGGYLCGTVFYVAPTGAFTTLHSFWDGNYGGPQEGCGPRASLLLTRAGNLFGTTSTGYWYGGGSVFRLETLPGAARVRSALTAAGTVRLIWTSPRAESFIIRRHTIGATDDVVLASGFSTTSFEDTTAAVAPGRAYAYTVTAINTYGAVDLAEVAVHAPSARGDDYDGDGTTDIAVFKPTNGMWFIIRSSNRNGVGTLFGNGSDLPVPGDYDGDGKTDLAVFRPSDGTWYIGMSQTNSSATIPYGNASDIPVPADYDGDGRTDLAVFRPSNGTWYIWQSSTNTLVTVVLGAAGDRPVMADYDGDGLTDVATFRPSTGTWTIRLSSTGEIINAGFGSAADTPIPGDYDGDGKADIAVFRSRTGYWEIWQSSTRTLKEIYYFLAGTIPVVGDYDGDGQTDQAIFVNGQWNALLSSGGQIYQIWGGPSDIPLPKHP